ncbi:MAG: PilZ domain-containing protein [Dehalococcoidia bacterium]|nr:PilZ domain-containing protein [Dehalococcoidia bacterium]
MEPPLAPGEMVLLLPRDGSRALLHAVIQQPLANGAALDISMEGAPGRAFERRDRVVLVVLRGDSRFAAEAIVVATSGMAGIRVQLLSPWRFIERRVFPRFETSMRVQVTSANGNELADARLLDISSGGMRLSADHAIDGRIDVFIHGRDGIRLPCDVIACRPTGRLFEVRARFCDLGQGQHRFVQDMVSALQALNERGRNLLAS